jgi:hypothetical protein
VTHADVCNTMLQVLLQQRLLLFRDNHAKYPVTKIFLKHVARLGFDIAGRCLSLVAGGREWVLRATESYGAAEWHRAMQLSIRTGCCSPPHCDVGGRPWQLRATLTCDRLGAG